MDQHPVPQNISSYEFRLVGDMTLKQFFQLAGGIISAVILYHTNLPFFVKWPLMILGIMMGIMLAFIPVGGRPFSQWLMAFIKTIYSPTQFVWNPSLTVPEPITPTIGASPSTKTTPLDRFEQQLMDRFTTIFKGQPVVISTQLPTITLPTIPTTPAPPLQASKPNQTLISTMTQVAPPVQAPPPQEVGSTPESVVQPIAPLPTPTTPITQDVSVTVNFTPRPTIVRTPEQAKLARFATNMPEPGQANILVGQVSDGTGLPMEGVIIEIAEAATDIPVRALRTNRLGQFQIATPLTSGKYVLHFEKDGFVFDSVGFEALGKIIAPVLVVGKIAT